MDPALKLNVFVGFPSYGGNGGISSEVPDIREWWVDTYLKMKADPRVGKVVSYTVGDTPVTMVRNRFVRLAREQGCHLLMMVDSDQSPDKHKHEPWYKPFWDVAFDEIYRHYQHGPLVIGAPYCGPPGAGENVYVFNFDNYGDYGNESAIKLNQYTRNQAARMSGVQPVAALPTGMILFDMRAFSLIEPTALSQRQVLEAVKDGSMSIADAERAHCQGWFYYEWKDGYASEKASTEDVTVTRDIALAGQVRLGYNPLRCAWDSWIGHYKPWNVGKPQPYCVENVAKSLRNAVEEDRRIDEVEVRLTAPDRLPPNWKKAPADSSVNAAEACRYKHNALASALQSHGLSEGLSKNTASEMIATYMSAKGDRKKALGDAINALLSPPPSPAVDWRTVHKTPEEDLQALKGLVAAAREYTGSATVSAVEVGSWLGDSACALLEGGVRDLLCVDCWPEKWNDPLSDAVQGYDREEAITLFVSRVYECANKHGAYWRYWDSPSLTAADSPDMTERQRDLVFLDADHSYEAVRDDIWAWALHVKPGGILCGHDYGVKAFPGVKRAVDEIFGEQNVNVVGRCIWWVRKPKDATPAWPLK